MVEKTGQKTHRIIGFAGPGGLQPVFEEVKDIGADRFVRNGPRLKTSAAADKKIDEMDGLFRSHGCRYELSALGLTKKSGDGNHELVDLVLPRADRILFVDKDAPGMLYGLSEVLWDQAITHSNSLTLMVKDGKIRLGSDKKEAGAQLVGDLWTDLAPRLSKLAHRQLPADYEMAKAAIGEGINLDLDWDLIVRASRVTQSVSYSKRAQEAAVKAGLDVGFGMHYHIPKPGMAAEETINASAADLSTAILRDTPWYCVRTPSEPENHQSKMAWMTYYVPQEQKFIEQDLFEVHEPLDNPLYRRLFGKYPAASHTWLAVNWMFSWPDQHPTILSARQQALREVGEMDAGDLQKFAAGEIKRSSSLKHLFDITGDAEQDSKAVKALIQTMERARVVFDPSMNNDPSSQQSIDFLKGQLKVVLAAARMQKEKIPLQ